MAGRRRKAPKGLRVEQLKRWLKDPPNRTCYESDTEVPQLKIRRNRDGSLTFCVRSRKLAGLEGLPAGPRPWVNLGPYPALSLADARDAARRLIAGVQVVGLPRRRESVTWADVREAYEVHSRRKGNRTVAHYMRLLERLVPKQWDHRAANSITWQEVKKVIDRVGAGTSTSKPRPGTASQLQIVISAAFNAAKAEGLEIANPLARRMRLYHSEARIRVLDFEEIRRIWDATGDIHTYGAAFRIMLLTGARPGEIRKAPWEHISSDGQWLNLPETKATRKGQDRSHRLFLGPLAQAELSKLERVSKWIFPQRRNPLEPVDAWNATVNLLRRSSGIEDFQAKQMRDTFVNQVLSHLDVEDQILKVCLNHRLPGTLHEHYLMRARLMPKAGKVWAEWDRFVSAILDGSVGEVVTLTSARASSDR